MKLLTVPAKKFQSIDNMVKKEKKLKATELGWG
jgi:hypothetical protein